MASIRNVENLGKTFLRISRMYQIIPLKLGKGLCIFTSFHFPDSGLYLLNFFWLLFCSVLNDIRDKENQQCRNWEITSLQNFLWKLYIQTWVCFFLSSSSFLLQAVMRSANCRLLISKSSCTFSTSTCFLSSRVDWTVLSPVSSSLLADCKTINIKRGVWIHRYMISAVARLLARGGLYNQKL